MQRLVLACVEILTSTAGQDCHQRQPCAEVDLRVCAGLKVYVVLLYGFGSRTKALDGYRQ